jgi:hypothetical protein
MSNFIHISDLFAKVVDLMRPTGAVIGSLVQVGTTNIYTITTDKLYDPLGYNIVAEKWIDLLSSSGAIVGSYRVTGVNYTAKTFTIERITAPSGTPATWKSQSPYYEHGHVLEVANTLSEKSKGNTLKFQKYPLVVLIEDIKEAKGKNSDANGNPDISIFIATLSKPTLNAEERKVASFDPILTPLYESLKYWIHYSRLFSTIDYTLIEHTVFERYYWGKQAEFANTKNIFNDWLDAIEIQNLNLIVKQKQNTPINKFITF